MSGERLVIKLPTHGFAESPEHWVNTKPHSYYKPVVIPCREPFLRHRWEWVRGTMAVPDHEYIERRCSRCGEYESEVR